MQLFQVSGLSRLEQTTFNQVPLPTYVDKETYACNGIKYISPGTKGETNSYKPLSATFG
jgi:hypothetical protein